MSDTKNRPIDVITIGRSSVDLYGQQVGGRIEDMGSFAKYVGGCPANIAIGSARLGLRPALLTRVGDDHMGRFLREQLEREGVNTDLIVSDPERLTALVLLGIRDKDQFPLLFYRENCADMAISGRRAWCQQEGGSTGEGQRRESDHGRGLPPGPLGPDQSGGGGEPLRGKRGGHGRTANGHYRL
jgi:hypothetical protein